MLKKILVANRGEIALRIIRAARALHIETVAVFAADEEGAAHASMADSMMPLGPGSLSETYLNIPKIIEAALESGAEAIHPGYGFLSESYLLAEACRKSNIVFIGPSPEVLRQMGNKLEAKALAESLQIPVLWNQTFDIKTFDTALDSLTFPVLIKSAHGGGGKGMQVVYQPSDLKGKVEQASRMALNYFGNGEVYLEPYIEKARHIEVQILGDNHDHLIHLYERDCTLQRNYQKIVEEAPAPNLPSVTREALLDAALRIGRKLSYSGAGTVEFLVGENGDFYFMEMNPRIQVEHPVTEMITGIDIVQEQLRIAGGAPLSFRQEDVVVKGHSLEVRIYSEDPSKDFAPSGVPVHYFHFPFFNYLRLETDLTETTSLGGSQYDPLLAKIITSGNTREQAYNRMMQALEQTVIAGPATNQRYLLALIGQEVVAGATYYTRYCETEMALLLRKMDEQTQNLPAEVLVPAFLKLRFLTADPNSTDPWKRTGFRNTLMEVDVQITGQHHRVGLSGLMIGESKANGLVDPEILTYTIDGISHSAEVITHSKDSVKVSVGNFSEEIRYRTNQLGAILFYWRGLQIPVSSRDLIEFYPRQGSAQSLGSNGVGDSTVVSHLFGKVVGIAIESGREVKAGDLLLVIESMKSENHIAAHRSGVIKSVEVVIGQQVTDKMPLIVFESNLPTDN